MTTEAQQAEGIHQGKRHTSRRKRVCAYMACNRVFKPGKPNQKYCSEKCRKLAYEVRRAASETAYESLFTAPPYNVPLASVINNEERLGTASIQRILTRAGLHYIEREGVWR